MDKTVWFLTSNPGKLAEAAHHFAQHGMVVRSLDVPAGAVIEPQASSLEEVAKAKLRQAMDHLPHHNAVVLVEDAGLFVDALDGFPGVYSSYVHETVGNLGMIRLLSHLQSEDPVQAKRLRSASFQAVAAMWDGENHPHRKRRLQGFNRAGIAGRRWFWLRSDFRAAGFG